MRKYFFKRVKRQLPTAATVRRLREKPLTRDSYLLPGYGRRPFAGGEAFWADMRPWRFPYGPLSVVNFEREKWGEPKVIPGALKEGGLVFEWFWKVTHSSEGQDRHRGFPLWGSRINRLYVPLHLYGNPQLLFPFKEIWSLEATTDSSFGFRSAPPLHAFFNPSVTTRDYLNFFLGTITLEVEEFSLLLDSIIEMNNYSEPKDVKRSIFDDFYDFLALRELHEITQSEKIYNSIIDDTFGRLPSILEVEHNMRYLYGNLCLSSEGVAASGNWLTSNLALDFFETLFFETDVLYGLNDEIMEELTAKGGFTKAARALLLVISSGNLASNFFWNNRTQRKDLIFAKSALLSHALDLLEPSDSGEGLLDTFEDFISYLSEDLLDEHDTFIGFELLYGTDSLEQFSILYDVVQGYGANLFSAYETADADLRLLPVGNQFEGSPLLVPDLFLQRTARLGSSALLPQMRAELKLDKHFLLGLQQTTNIMLKSFTAAKFSSESSFWTRGLFRYYRRQRKSGKLWSRVMQQADAQVYGDVDIELLNIPQALKTLPSPFSLFDVGEMSPRLLSDSVTFPMRGIYPYHLDDYAYDTAEWAFHKDLDWANFFVNPDAEYLKRVLKYQTIWLARIFDLEDYIYKHDNWLAHREYSYASFDTWRDFSSLLTPRSNWGFPFWSFRRVSFLPVAKNKK